MRIKEFITELFHNPAPFRWFTPPDANTDLVSANFKVGNVEYDWYAALGTEPNSWEVEFKDSDLGYGITGKGNAAIVMSTVINIMQEFIAKSGATQIAFSASEPSRKNLYAAIIRRLMSNWDAKHIGSNFIVTSPRHQPDDSE
jgi:hypothetical protein